MMPRITYSHLMLATSARAPLPSPGWIFELKYDGMRVLVTKHGDRLRLESARGRNLTASFPEVVAAASAIPHDFVIDGELVVCDGRGRPQYERLERRSRASQPATISRGASEDPAAVFAFDLLWLDGNDYRPFPLAMRKGMLQHVVSGSPRLIYASHFEASPADLWALARKFKLEGIVAKDASSPYVAGRSERWLAIRSPSKTAPRKGRPRTSAQPDSTS